MSKFLVKHGDTLPVMEVLLKNTDGSAFDLTDLVSATLVVRQPGAPHTVETRTMTVYGDPTAGVLRYYWQAGDWSGADEIVVGEHKVEIEVVLTSGTITFPSEGYDTLVVTEDLGDTP